MMTEKKDRSGAGTRSRTVVLPIFSAITGSMILSLAFFLLLPLSSWNLLLADQTEGEDPLSLEWLITEALEKNPGINALTELESVKRAVVPQVYSLPDPVLAFSLRNVGLDHITVGEEMMAGRMLSFTQKIPFPGKLGLKRDGARFDLEAAHGLTEERRAAVVAGVRTAYNDLFYIYETIDTVRELEDVLDLFLATAESRYVSGEGGQADVLKAHLEISRLAERLVLLEERKALLESRISRLIGRDSGTGLGRPAKLEMTSPDASLEEMKESAETGAPEVLYRDALVQREERGLGLAKREYLPDLYLGAAWTDRGAFEDIWEVRVGIDLPLYFWTKEKRGVEEARHRYTKAGYDLDEARLSLAQQVRDLYVELESSERLYSLYEQQLLPQADLTLESSRLGYESGEVDFLTLIDNLKLVLNYRIEFVGQLVRHENALAELEALTGGSTFENNEEGS